MKRILFLLAVIFTCHASAQVKVCQLPSTSIGSINDYIIKEDSDCTNGTKKMTIEDFFNAYGINYDTSLGGNYVKTDGSVVGATGQSQVFTNGITLPSLGSGGMVGYRSDGTLVDTAGVPKRIRYFGYTGRDTSDAGFTRRAGYTHINNKSGADSSYFDNTPTLQTILSKSGTNISSLINSPSSTEYKHQGSTGDFSITLNDSDLTLTSRSVGLTWPRTDGTAGQVLKTDGAGALGWASVSDSAWGLQGNAGTNPATDFIGTTDAQDFIIKSYNTEIIRFDTLQNIATLGSIIANNDDQCAISVNTTIGNSNIISNQDTSCNISDNLCANASTISSANNSSNTMNCFAASASNISFYNVLTNVSYGTAISGGAIAFQDTNCNISNSVAMAGSYVSNGASGKTINNAVAIGTGAISNSTNSLTWSNGLGTVYGTDNVATFGGTLKIADGTQGANKVLTSDTNGLASWSTTIQSGTFTPTISDSTNVDATSISVDAMWTRINNVVTVTYHVNVDPTTTATATDITIDYPASLNANPSANVSGYGMWADAVATGIGAVVTPVDAVTLKVSWTPVATTSKVLSFTVTYQSN